MVWKPLNLPLEILISAIQQLPLQNFSIGDVIEVLWAVVLRKYMGSDQIAFNRLVQGHEVASCISMNLDQDKLESFGRLSVSCFVDCSQK
jgi:hypothetical protein